MEVDTQRLALLGQITVMRDRLNDLEHALIDVPMGYAYVDEAFTDAQGNLSFQTGVLIGQLSKYRDLLKKRER